MNWRCVGWLFVVPETVPLWPRGLSVVLQQALLMGTLSATWGVLLAISPYDRMDAPRYATPLLVAQIQTINQLLRVDHPGHRLFLTLLILTLFVGIRMAITSGLPDRYPMQSRWLLAGSLLLLLQFAAMGMVSDPPASLSQSAWRVPPSGAELPPADDTAYNPVVVYSPGADISDDGRWLVSLALLLTSAVVVGALAWSASEPPVLPEQTRMTRAGCAVALTFLVLEAIVSNPPSSTTVSLRVSDALLWWSPFENAFFGACQGSLAGVCLGGMQA